ncbi:hypothetical protein V5D56_13135 [Cellulosimicrobium sp. PMB13]|jgi:hypothetical protein|uniref:hypothetical protein n=1 Tax=Cellulosimicrobium sp. PMB13 TaxID=3120158 RepID=UPI003F4C2BFF
MGEQVREGSTRQAGRSAQPDDVRDVVGVGVLLPNGRLAGRAFASRAEAEAWARPEEGEQVVELNVLCDCDL